MTSNWQELWGLVQQMGAERVKDIDITLPPPQSNTFHDGLAKGVEVRLEDIDSRQSSGELLSVDGRQVLVYIPDQGNSLASVLRNPESGKRFHVSHCSTLRSMLSQNRNHRYVATNDTSGMFNLTDWTGTEKARGRLSVCKNCLNHINYQDYSGRYKERTKIFRSFNLIEFFSTYSSLFKYPYASTRNVRQAGNVAVAEAAGEWSTVITPRACSKCSVTLPSHVELANKTDSSSKIAPVALCADCHRREHWQDAAPVLIGDMRRITKERRQQGLLTDIGTWEEAFDLADPAFHGLMKIYQRQGRSVPEVGYPLTDGNGVVLEAELALAWEISRFGVVASAEEQIRCKADGWRVLNLGEALIDGREDG